MDVGKAQKFDCDIMRKYVHTKVLYLHFSPLDIYEGSYRVLKNKMTNSLQILEPCFLLVLIIISQGVETGSFAPRK